LQPAATAAWTWNDVRGRGARGLPVVGGTVLRPDDDPWRRLAKPRGSPGPPPDRPHPRVHRPCGPPALRGHGGCKQGFGRPRGLPARPQLLLPPDGRGDLADRTRAVAAAVAPAPGGGSTSVR